MTMATGWVANVWQLALTRFLMGAGEACGIAPSNSLLGDLFRDKRRPLAMSIFGTATATFMGLNAFAAGFCLLAAGRCLDTDIARAQEPVE